MMNAWTSSLKGLGIDAGQLFRSAYILFNPVWISWLPQVKPLISSDQRAASACENSQALAARWSELIKGFTGGNQEIQTGLNKMYADRNNWPASMPKPFSDEVQAFIIEAMKP